MLFKKRFFSVILFFLFTITSFSQTKQIKIIETTDTHGAISPYNLTYDSETGGGLARIYTYVENERINKNQSVVLLSGGDIIQGTPEVYYYNFEKLNAKHLYAEVMNFMKYDAGTVGNHDIETGHTVYDRFNKELNFPWLGANATNTESGKPYFKPYTVIEREGIKIAVLGLITPAIPKWLPKKIWSGIFFEDMIESAKKWVLLIKEKEKPDLLVGLFHAGGDPDYNGASASDKFNENASILVAEQVPGFDIVYVGHDHKGWNKKVKNAVGDEVLILGGTSSGREIAAANVTLTFNSELKKWDAVIEGEIIDLKDYSPSEVFMDKFAPGLKEVQKYVSKPLAVFEEKISTCESMFGPSKFVDLINNIQLDLTDADISFSAPLSFDAAIEADTVYVKDMFKLYKYENLLYTIVLSGNEIKNYLEFTASNWFNQMKSEEDHLIAFQEDENGEIEFSKRHDSPITKTSYYNYDAAAGINYTIDVSKKEGERINIISLSSGKPFEYDKVYKVAINSYRGNGGGNHLSKGVGLSKEEIDKRIINSTDKDLRFYLMKWIEKEKIVTPKLNDNWRIIPESYWLKGKEKDYKLMYAK